MKCSVGATTMCCAAAMLLAGCGGPTDPLGPLEGKGDWVDGEQSWNWARSRVCPPGGPGTNLHAMPVQGFDVSYHQPHVDWAGVATSGKQFAIARTSDGYRRDSSFVSHYQGMKRAGLIRGAYHFLRPGKDARRQASLFLAALEAAGGLQPGDLPPVLDIETYDEPAAVVQQKMRIWLDIVGEATGTQPIVYTMGGMSSLVGSGFADHYLWVANFYQTCPRTPAGWGQWPRKWNFHQYTDRGRVAGIHDGTEARTPIDVDLDVFNGTLGELQGIVARRGCRPDHACPFVR